MTITFGSQLVGLCTLGLPPLCAPTHYRSARPAQGLSTGKAPPKTAPTTPFEAPGLRPQTGF